MNKYYFFNSSDRKDERERLVQEPERKRLRIRLGKRDDRRTSKNEIKRKRESSERLRRGGI